MRELVFRLDLIYKMLTESEELKGVNLTKLTQALKTICIYMKKIHQHWEDRVVTHKEKSASKLLFTSLHSPPVSLVGHIIELNYGHTKEWQWREEAKLNRHLSKLGFGDPRDNKNSILNVNKVTVKV